MSLSLGWLKHDSATIRILSTCRSPPGIVARLTEVMVRSSKWHALHGPNEIWMEFLRSRPSQSPDESGIMGNSFSKGATEIRVKNLLLFELARVLVVSFALKLGDKRTLL
jgi:hypothetical protein